MFKKTLVAVAALAAFGTVSAANFTLYGTVDEGLFYSYKKDANDVKTHNLGVASGTVSASKFGFKGTEDLGNGLKVGFKLENQFSADDGQLSQGRLFRREASLSVYSDYGTISLGRMGGVGSSAGTYDIIYGYGDAFDGFDNDIGDGLVSSARYDNMVTYQTPKFGGVQATVQYSFKEDGKDGSGVEGKASANRYAGAALTGDFGPLGVAAAYEFQNYSSVDTPDADDGHTVYLAANYDCGVAKTFAMVQYFKGMQSAVKADAAEDSKGIKGFGATVGTVFGLLGGETTVAVYYADGKEEQKVAGVHEDDLSYLGASARYVYPLSKRTSVYVGAGMAKYDRKTEADKEKTTIGQAYLGMTHQF